MRIFDAAGARNVRFVWSVNPNLYEPAGAWRRGAARLLARAAATSTLVGSTMIDFGGLKSYPVAPLRRRGCAGCARRYRKPSC